MAAQVPMLAPASESNTTQLPKKVVPWAPPSTLTLDSQPQRSGTLLDPRLRTDFQGNSDGVTHAQASTFDILAHSMQFVASPGRSHKLQSILPAAIREAFSGVPAFAGCMAMVSDQEARRVTIVTFWKGCARRQHCGENAEPLKAILFPYVDHWLRAENHVAHFAMCTDRGEAERAGLPVSGCDPTMNA
jgi:hypothetical protein